MINPVLNRNSTKLKPILFPCNAGLFDFSVTGCIVKWVFPDGRISFSSRPAFTLSSYGVVKLYAKYIGNFGVVVNDYSTDSKFLGKLKDLQGKLTYYLNLSNCYNLSGSLLDLKGKLTYFLALDHSTQVTGSLEDLQGKLTYLLSLINCSQITGNLDSLNGKLSTYLGLTGCTQITGVYLPIGAGIPTTTILSNTGLSTNDMDQTLINYAATTKNNGSFTANGKTRSSVSNTAVTTLQGRGWSIMGLTVV